MKNDERKKKQIRVKMRTRRGV